MPVPLLRLFGPARTCAGTGRAHLPGSSVAELIDEATRRYGPEFAEVVGASRLWVNGEAAGRDRTLDDHDELAVLPPVSGG